MCKLSNPALCERRLIGAIIEQSFRDIHSVNYLVRSEAINWLCSPSAAQFAEIIGIDGEVLSRGVRYHIDLMEKKSKMKKILGIK